MLSVSLTILRVHHSTLLRNKGPYSIIKWDAFEALFDNYQLPQSSKNFLIFRAITNVQLISNRIGPSYNNKILYLARANPAQKVSIIFNSEAHSNRLGKPMKDLFPLCSQNSYKLLMTCASNTSLEIFFDIELIVVMSVVRD